MTKRALHGKRLFFWGWGVESVGAPPIFWRFALARQGPTPSTPCKCSIPLPVPRARATLRPLHMCPHALHWHISVLQDTLKRAFVSPSLPAWINFFPFKTPPNTPECQLFVHLMYKTQKKLRPCLELYYGYTIIVHRNGSNAPPNGVVESERKGCNG